VIDDGLINKVSYAISCSILLSVHVMICVFLTLMDNGFLSCLPYHRNKSTCPMYNSKLIVTHIIHCIFNFLLFIFFLLYDGFNILHDRKNFSWHCSRQTRRKAYLQIGYAEDYLLFFYNCFSYFHLMEEKKNNNMIFFGP
jgi:hypothetical protein